MTPDQAFVRTLDADAESIVHHDAHLCWYRLRLTLPWYQRFWLDAKIFILRLWRWQCFPRSDGSRL
jgi:hypothetical protein